MFGMYGFQHVFFDLRSCVWCQIFFLKKEYDLWCAENEAALCCVCHLWQSHKSACILKKNQRKTLLNNESSIPLIWGTLQNRNKIMNTFGGEGVLWSGVGWGGGDAMSSHYVNHAGSHLCFLTFTIKHYSCFQIPPSVRNNPTLLGPMWLKLYHLSNLLLFHPCQDNLLWVFL